MSLIVDCPRPEPFLGPNLRMSRGRTLARTTVQLMLFSLFSQSKGVICWAGPSEPTVEHDDTTDKHSSAEWVHVAT
jgi:hypothetical protein